MVDHAAEFEMHYQPPEVTPMEQLWMLAPSKVRRQLSRTKSELRRNPESALQSPKTPLN